MNKQIEALKMARQHIIERKGGRGGAVCYVKKDEDIIKAIDEALAEAEKQEIGEAEIRQMLKEIEWCHQELEKKENQEPVAWMEEYQSCKVNGDERLCHSDKVFRLVQLLASQLSECQSLCAKYAEETVKNGEQKLKEVTAIKEALEKAEKREPVGIIYQDMDTLRPAFRFTRPFEYKATTALNPDVPLYAHPATWQGLSDDEIKSTYKELFPTTTMKLNSALIKYVQTLELILRDKNERK